jgi:hypothetical protein
MVLNLKILKRLPRKPTRSCKKRIGPGEASLIHIASKIKIGSQKGMLIKINAVSKMRFHSGMIVKRLNSCQVQALQGEESRSFGLDRFELVAGANRLDVLL